jgi:hypothetical protein
MIHDQSYTLKHPPIQFMPTAISFSLPVVQDFFARLEFFSNCRA